MRTWKEYFETWTKEPLSVRSTGDEKEEEHFVNIANHISDILELSKNDLVIDVGCNSGLVTEKVADKVYKITGIDFIEEFIKDALELKRSHNSDYIEANAESLPFEAQLFSKGYCYNMIHGLPNKDCGVRVIEELIRVCKSNSIILIGDIPDTKKKYRYLWQRRWFQFKKGTLKRKAKMLTGLILPEWAKRFIKKRGLKVITESKKGPGFIWHDLEELKKIFEKQCITCKITDQKKGLHDYCYRSNLILKKK